MVSRKEVEMKILVTLVLVLSGATAFAGGGSSIGPANPAAVNCLKLGGSEERVETSAGESTNCVVEEWSLFRAMSALNQVKSHEYGLGGMANPSSVNCDDINGSLRVIESTDGQAGYCVIEEWKLFKAMYPAR